MADKKTGRKFKWWHALGLLTLLFIGFVVYTGFDLALSTGPAVDATDEFFTEISTGENLEAIYEEDIADGFKEVTSYEEFAMYVESIEIVKNYDYIELHSRGLYEDQGVEFVSLLGTMHGTNGDIVSVEVQVVEEDGKWKIRYVDLQPID